MNHGLTTIGPLTRRALVAAVAALGTGAAARAQGTPTAAGFSFTDDRGITVTLPERPRRIAAFTPIAAALWDLGVKPAAVFGPLTKSDGTVDPQAGNIDPAHVTWLGDFDAFDLERLVTIDPDLVIGLELADVPDTLWYIPLEVFPAVEELAPTIGIRATPGNSVASLFDRIEGLATALGADLAAPAQTAARADFDAALSELDAAAAAKSGLSVIVMYAGPDDFGIANPAWFGDLALFAEHGVTFIGPESDQRWTSLSWEEIGRFQPDLYLVDARNGDLDSVLAPLAEIATWQAQPAVQAGQIGPWSAVYPYGRQSFTRVVLRLTEDIRATDPDIAP